MYTPPFTISSHAIHLIANISAQVERYAIRMEQEDSLLLRKINRIKTIQGSLAIEGNTLSESQITDIIEGDTSLPLFVRYRKCEMPLKHITYITLSIHIQWMIY